MTAGIDLHRYEEKSKYIRTGREREYFRLLRELVENCQVEGSIPADVDPADMVDRLVTIHRGTLVNWRLCQEEFDLIEMGRKIAGDMIKGLGV